MNEVVKNLYEQAEKHLKEVSIGCFEGMDKPLVLVSEKYPGIWLEHLYDAIIYAKLYKGETEYMKNVINLFIDNQTEEGQLPSHIWDRAKVGNDVELIHYSQIQECVSFGSLCVLAYEISGDKNLLEKCYNACKKWVGWLENNRMTTNRGLIEMFVGFDTGHDNSGRFDGMSCKGLYEIDGVEQNASVMPENDEVAPIIAVDMNCNFYGNLKALEKMSQLLGISDETALWEKKASDVKRRLFEVCYDENDCFFYDVDKKGNKRKYKSSTILHLFLEKVLDKTEDAELIEKIYDGHIKNPDEFWTPYPFPSMAYNDPSAKQHEELNCWGYFTQTLIVLRCTLWMDYYGKQEDFDYVLTKWLEAWTVNSDKLKFGQEIDPVTGVPSPSSEWYSSGILLYIYATRRLHTSIENSGLKSIK